MPRVRLFRVVRIASLSAIAAVVGVNLFLNIWLLFGCDYCVGHECRQSLCGQYRDHCSDRCYGDNLIDDNRIVIKRPVNVTQVTEPAVYWQRLVTKKYDQHIYIYSAIHSAQDKYVLIISKVFYGAGETGDKYNDFRCVLLDDNQTTLDTTDAKFTKFYQHFTHYETTRITCPLSDLIVIRPAFVRLVHRPEDVWSEPIPIQYPKEEEVPEKRQIIVCVRPLFNFSSVRILMEFIAYYKINGVDRFVFYNKSATEEVRQLFSAMSDFIDVYPWTLNDGTVLETKEELSGPHRGCEDQLSAFDHCLHLFRHHIILFVDVDEFFVPFNDRTLEVMIRREYASEEAVSLSMQMVLFCCEFNEQKRKDFPRILNHFSRQSTVWLRGMRPKVIALRPELIEQIGVHEVSSLTATATMAAVKHVEPTDGLMFHFRTCCRMERTPLFWKAMSIRTLSDAIEYDDRINRFGEEIMRFIDRYFDLN